MLHLMELVQIVRTNNQLIASKMEYDEAGHI